MTGKHLLTISLLLPFMAISSVVQADAATATKRHMIFNQTMARAEALPRPSPYYGSGVGAYYGTGTATEACAYQYQGGPKSSLWTCQR
jgi:hypothetical protein